MGCPRCGGENRAGAKFCNECAAPLPVHCDACRAENRPGARFCMDMTFWLPQTEAVLAQADEA